MTLIGVCLPQGLVVSVVMWRGDGTFKSRCLEEGSHGTGATPQNELLLILLGEVVMELAPRAWPRQHMAFPSAVMPSCDAARIPLPEAK